jgi:hypothetical protein
MRCGADVEVFGLLVFGKLIEARMPFPRMGRGRRAERVNRRRRQRRFETGIGVIGLGADGVDAWFAVMRFAVITRDPFDEDATV